MVTPYCAWQDAMVFVVRNNNELSVILKFFQEFNKAGDIGIVLRSIHFIENAEGAWFYQIDGKEK